MVFHPFANVPVTNTSLGPFAFLPLASSAFSCPSSSFHLIKVGTPLSPAPRSTAAAIRFLATVSDGTLSKGIGIAATGALNTAGGSNTAGEGTTPFGDPGTEEGGEAITLVPDGISCDAMGRAESGTGGAWTVSLGAAIGGVGEDVCGGGSWCVSVVVVLAAASAAAAAAAAAAELEEELAEEGREAGVLVRGEVGAWMDENAPANEVCGVAICRRDPAGSSSIS